MRGVMILKKKGNNILLTVILSMILISTILILSGCMKVAPPSQPIISLFPVAPVAGQKVTVSVKSNDDYSDISYSVAVDGTALPGNSASGVFYWTAQEGTHTIVATVSDTYGNSVSASKHLKVKMPSPPSIEKIRWDPISPIGGEQITFETEATSVIGISDLTMKLDSAILNVTNNGDTYTAKWKAVPGDHALEISVKDMMGTTSSTRVIVNVGPYPFPKIMTFTWTPQNPSLEDRFVTFKVIGEDPNGFYANISVDGNDLNTTQISSNTYVATWDIISGYHEVEVNLEDLKGWCVKKIYHISIEPPQSDLNVQVGITPSTPKHGDKVTIKAYASDSYAPIQMMSLFIDGAISDTVSTNVLSYTFFPSDGNHEIKVEAVDKMNKKAYSQLFFTVSFNPLMYPPQLKARFTQVATVGTAKILTAFASPTAPNAVIKKVTFVNMLNSSLLGESLNGNNGKFSISWVPKRAGYIPILVSAVDSYNTVSSTTVMVKVSPGLLNENSPIIKPEFDSFIKQSSRVSLCASVSDKNEIENVETWVDEVPITPSKNASGLYCVKWIAEATGTHNFTVAARDVYGHEATETFYFYVYPGKLPIVRLRIKPTKLYVGQSVVATADVLKSNAEIDYVNFYVDGKLKATQYLPPYVFKEKTEKSGVHSLMAEAVDMYANKGYAQSNFVVEKDKTPPYLNISAPSTVASGQKVKVNIITYDRESNVKSLNVDVYSSKSPNLYPDIIPIISKVFSYPSTCTTLTFKATKGAVYEINVISKDEFGNSSSLKKTIVTK